MSASDLSASSERFAEMRRKARERVHLADTAPAVISALKELIATIELHNDCMTGEVPFDVLEPFIERAEEAIHESEGKT